ncbi:hypothetical protein C8R48DRAFT_767367 [Suillus tomentosus]|nr:hypothetical protein C8R48DRAFT_767367 [Suillus tomentosus]
MAKEYQKSRRYPSSFPTVVSANYNLCMQPKMITPSVAELVELFDAEGAFIFVERTGIQKPRFHVEKASTIKAAGCHFPTRVDAGVLIAPDLLYDMPAMLGEMARSLANDMSVAIIYAYTEDLANHLVSEAMKLDNAPFMSGTGRLMDRIMGKSG